MRALIVVDVQKDFCEGGALAVQGGNNVAQDIAEYITEDGDYYDEILFTLDWHAPPPNDNGGHFGDPPDYVNSWPVHCVAGSEGAEFHDALKPLIDGRHIFRKGFGRPDYSGFQGVNSNDDDLATHLKREGIDEIHVCGLAADYCVRATALDGIANDFRVLMLPSLTAAVHENGVYTALLQILETQND